MVYLVKTKRMMTDERATGSSKIQKNPCLAQTHILVDAVCECNVGIENPLNFAGPPVAGVPRQADCLL